MKNKAIKERKMAKDKKGLWVVLGLAAVATWLLTRKAKAEPVWGPVPVPEPVPTPVPFHPLALAEGLITISGRVTDVRGTHLPIAGAEITLYIPPLTRETPVRSQPKIYTDSNGWYSAEIPPGEYAGWIYKAGYLPKAVFGQFIQYPTFVSVYELLTTDWRRDITLQLLT